MVAIPRRQRLNLPLAPVAAGVLATLAALIFAALPASILERLVLDSGIAALIPAAEPPLGFTARAALILIGGGGVALIGWFALFLLVGQRTISFAGREGEGVPVLRRADAHPDAPPRRPVFANEDLGTPFLEVRARPIHAVAAERTPPAAEAVAPSVVPAEQDLPVNLDVPMAHYDPLAIPDEPIDWFPPPAQLIQPARRQMFDAGERFETFALTPAPYPVPDPAEQPLKAPVRSAPRSVAPVIARHPSHGPDYDSSASIHALLDRLEKGVTRREPEPEPMPIARPQREESLQEALVSLRRMATRT